MISYASIDNIFVSIGQISLFTIIAITALAIHVIIVFVKIFLRYNGKTVPLYLIKILRFLLVITCEICFIPISITLLILFKYSESPKTMIYEYSNYPSSSQLKNFFVGKVTSIIFLVFHLLITLSYKGFFFEIGRNKASKDFKAKSMPDIDLRVALVNFFHCVCFISIQQEYYSYYPFVNLLTFGYCAWSYFFYLPYYSDLMNFFKIFLYFDCFCISLFFIVANFFQDALVVEVLTIVFQPIIYIQTKNAIFYRKLKVQKKINDFTQNFKIFELYARKSLESQTNPLILMKKLYRNYLIEKNKLIFVYQAHYCSKILKNHGLALVKASQTNYKGLSIFTNFQLYSCQKKLEKKNLKISSGLRLFLYLHDLNSLTKEDKNFCMFFLNFFNVVLAANPNTSDVMKNFRALVDLIHKVKEKYEDCLKKHPNSQIINEMYGSLLKNIFFDQEKGESHLSFSLYCAKAYSIIKENNIYLKKDLYYMVISGDSKETGKIIYSSNNLKAILGINFDEDGGSYLTELIPKPYSKNHDLKLIKFIRNSLTNKMIGDIPLFLSNKEGFLIECIINSECLGYESSVMFIAILDFAKNFDREAAIVDEN